MSSEPRIMSNETAFDQGFRIGRRPAAEGVDKSQHVEGHRQAVARYRDAPAVYPDNPRGASENTAWLREYSRGWLEGAGFGEGS